MPMENVLAFYNVLADMYKREQENAEKQQKDMTSGTKVPNLPGGMQNQINSMSRGMKVPNMPSMPSMPNMPHF